MDVKCMKFPRMRTISWRPEMMAHDVAHGGKAILGAIRDKSADLRFKASGSEYRPHIELMKGQWSMDTDNKSNDKNSVPEYTTCDAIAMLGGRASIVKWLRLHGEEPSISHPMGGHELHVYIARKHQHFGKDMTLVMVCPHDGLVAGGSGGWQVRPPVDLRKTPESVPSAFGNIRMADTTPHKLATTLERLFAGSAF